MSSLWNWNGLFREGVAGNHQGAIPDGQLCSGGRTEGGRYNALDAVGAWKTSPVSSNFRVRLYDQASHGADYIRVYVTKQGFNALTQPLGWGNLELVGQIGNTPASQWTPESDGGVSIQIPANAPGRTGNQWSGGFQADVTVTAGGSAIRGWSVSWTFANGQQVTQAWNATVSRSGDTVVARNVDYNGNLGAGASTTFGFTGSWNGSNPVPVVACTTA
ncbi:cellulose binding domain-containing protein [Micromonospora sp. H33]|uniref:cellulose binding domain-containing protein n=1 Tax=Micromonospora sp. H33 TaxID=3452215 RepID=UPI003F8CA3FF